MNRGRLAFTAALAAFAATLLLEAPHFGAAARRVPIIVLTPTLAMLLLQLLIDVRSLWLPAGAVTVSEPRSVTATVLGLWERPELKATALVVVIGLGVELLGVTIAVPLLLGLFLVFAARVELRQALLAGLLTFALIEVGLSRLLGALLPAGRLWRWLGL